MKLVLGPSMVYSCAYFEQEPSATYTLEDAQRAKLDLVARKLGLTPGARLLDVGCGWGAFVIHAAREYGVDAVGVTALRGAGRLRASSRRLAGACPTRCRSGCRTTATSATGRTTRSPASVWPSTSGCPGWASTHDRLHSLLAPGGRLLNHAISRRPGPPGDPRGNKTSFIDRYVFPDGELHPMSTMVDVLESAGFEVRDVESLREHYEYTLRAWVQNLERNWDQAVALSSAGRARVWRLYMAGSALAFQSNRLGVNQVLAVKPGARRVQRLTPHEGSAAARPGAHLNTLPQAPPTPR